MALAPASGAGNWMVSASAGWAAVVAVNGADLAYNVSTAGGAAAERPCPKGPGEARAPARRYTLCRDLLVARWNAPVDVGLEVAPRAGQHRSLLLEE